MFVCFDFDFTAFFFGGYLSYYTVSTCIKYDLAPQFIALTSDHIPLTFCLTLQCIPQSEEILCPSPTH